MTLFLISIALLFCCLILYFLYFSPQFGARPQAEEMEKLARQSLFRDKTFHNQIPTSMEMGPSQYGELILQYLKGGKGRKPEAKLPVQNLEAQKVKLRQPDTLSYTWFGHSAILLEKGALKVFLDPMLSQVPAPHPWLGSSRYQEHLPLAVADLPLLDAVVISHDHYDHLDYNTIVQIEAKTKKFFVPLGVKAHFLAWGIASEKVVELDWYQSQEWLGITFTATPARHFSGRGLSDRNATLWASWVLEWGEQTLYFSGDSGYGPHFKAIGERFGPIDLAFMECGQYHPYWENIHMLPEQTVQAAKDLEAKWVMPIHWGTFTLSLHSWTDPAEQITKWAARENLNLIFPEVGETKSFGREEPRTKSYWWQKWVLR